MPTYERSPRFRRDYDALTAAQRRLFHLAVTKFVDDLRRGQFRPGLRVKAYQGIPGWFEMTWAPDGRALFRFGEAQRPGDPHVVWLPVGGHEIVDNP